MKEVVDINIHGTYRKSRLNKNLYGGNSVTMGRGKTGNY